MRQALTVCDVKHTQKKRPSFINADTDRETEDEKPDDDANNAGIRSLLTRPNFKSWDPILSHLARDYTALPHAPHFPVSENFNGAGPLSRVTIERTLCER